MCNPMPALKCWHAACIGSMFTTLVARQNRTLSKAHGITVTLRAARASALPPLSSRSRCWGACRCLRGAPRARGAASLWPLRQHCRRAPSPCPGKGWGARRPGPPARSPPRGPPPSPRLQTSRAGCQHPCHMFQHCHVMCISCALQAESFDRKHGSHRAPWLEDLNLTLSLNLPKMVLSTRLPAPGGPATTKHPGTSFPAAFPLLGSALSVAVSSSSEPGWSARAAAATAARNARSPPSLRHPRKALEFVP